jgi:phage-related minor tail protein
MGEAVVRAANQSTEAIVEFVRTGKFSFSSLVESILIDLTRIAVQKTITGPLAAAISGVIPDLFRTGGGGIAGAQGITAGDGINFANGGIMTRFGEASLKRYAGGGIANSPQLALFGEGTRPEAYVPLPDGRSIPVTMAGAMPSVQLNVFNQTGQPVDAAQGQPRMDGGKMVLDVVLTAANQPGPFRDAMRNAMK